MSNETRSKTLAETIREHVSELQNARAELADARDALAAEIEAIHSAPIGPADALQFCMDYIDSRAKAYVGHFDHLAKALDELAWPRRRDVPAGAAGFAKGAPLCLRDVDAGLSGDWQAITAHFADGLRFFGSGTPGHRFDEAAYFFFGDIIKSKLRENFDQLYSGAPVPAEYAELSIAARRERIASLVAKRNTLDADIAGIDAELATIRTDAGAASSGAPMATCAALDPVADATRDRAIWMAVNDRGWLTEFGSWVNAGENAIAQRFGVSREHVDRIAVLKAPPAP